MKKIRAFASSSLTIFTITTSFAFVSCNRYNSINDEVIHTSANYTGKDLYKSIFFATGKFAKEIPLYKNDIERAKKMNLEDKHKFDRNIEILLIEIENKNPTFFKDFKDKIFSKNHQTVENAIILGAEKLFETLHHLYPNIDELYQKIEKDYIDGKLSTKEGDIDHKKLEQKSQQYADILKKNMITPDDNHKAVGCSWAIACVLYAALAVHNTIAITALIAVAAAIKFKVGVEHILHNDLLQFEILVNDIVQYTEK